MRLTLITMLVATMLAACGSLNTTRATNSDGTAVQATSASQSDATGSNTKKLKGGVIKRVLVVDDSKTEATKLKDMLEKNGFWASHVTNGVHAMVFLRDSADDALPDLIMTTVELYHMNGYQLTRALTSDARYQHIPIIIVTYQAFWENDAEVGQKAGARDYIIRPFDVEELMDRINHVLNCNGSLNPCP